MLILKNAPYLNRKRRALGKSRCVGEQWCGGGGVVGVTVLFCSKQKNMKSFESPMDESHPG